MAEVFINADSRGYFVVTKTGREFNEIQTQYDMYAALALFGVKQVDYSETDNTPVPSSINKVESEVKEGAGMRWVQGQWIKVSDLKEFLDKRVDELKDFGDKSREAMNLAFVECANYKISIINEIVDFVNKSQQAIPIPVESQPLPQPIEPDFKFTKWVGKNYTRLHGCWCHRYSDQMDKKNWIETKRLYEIYKSRPLPPLTDNPIK